jgi:hypothetical protein
MNNVLPFPTALRAVPAVLRVLPPIAIDEEDEMDVQLWELAMSGQRGSNEYQRLESMISRTVSRWDSGRQLPPR